MTRTGLLPADRGCPAAPHASITELPYLCRCAPFHPLYPVTCGNCQSILCTCERGDGLPFFLTFHTQMRSRGGVFLSELFRLSHCPEGPSTLSQTAAFRSFSCPSNTASAARISGGSRAGRPWQCARAVPPLCGPARDGAAPAPGLNGTARYRTKQHETQSSARETDAVNRCVRPCHGHSSVWQPAFYIT